MQSQFHKYFCYNSSQFNKSDEPLNNFNQHMGVPCLMFWAHVLPRLTPAIRRSVRRSKPRQAVRGARRPYSPPRKILRGQPITSSTISHTSAQKQELAILERREHKTYNTCAATHFSVTVHCASFNYYININIYSISNVSCESIDKNL